MKGFIFSRREQLILNSVLVIYLFLIFKDMPVYANDYFLLWSKDSKEYYSTGREFFNFSETGFSHTRPFLFPLFLRATHSLGGASLVWLLHCLMWIISANLIFNIIRKWTNNLIYASIGVVAFAMNISLIALTFHGLTEISTVLLLCLLALILVNNKTALFEAHVFVNVIGILVALTLVKPLFYIPLVAILAVGFWFYLKSFKENKKHFIFLGLVLFPLVFQMSVMKIKYDRFTVSMISELTFRRYLVAQGIERLELIPRDTAIVRAEQMSAGEMKTYLKENKDLYYSLCMENLKFNIKAYPSYLAMNTAATYKAYFNFMNELNVYYLHFFRIIRFCFIVLLLYSLIRKKLRENLVLLSLMTFYLYIQYSSMISFYQGDRLTIFALPLLVIVTIFLLHGIINKIILVIRQRKLSL